MKTQQSPGVHELIDLPGGFQQLQRTWTRFGIEAQETLGTDPESFSIRSSPYGEWIWNQALLESLGHLPGKAVLELGCGLGKFSVFLAKQGAEVSGVDISEEAIKTAEKIANLNQVECAFYAGDIVSLPSENAQFDLVVGVAILHHLSKPDVRQTLAEVHRVLKPGAKAVLLEPIENDPYFSFLQNIFPAGIKSSGYYRPSIFCRKGWKKYLREMEDRDLTTAELLEAGTNFRKVVVRGFGLISRLDRLLRTEESIAKLHYLDNLLFRRFPFLERYARNNLVVYYK